MATSGLHTEMKTVFETRISVWIRLRGIKMQRWIVMSCEEAWSSKHCEILTWDFSWCHEEVKEDALWKGFPVPDEAATRARVLRENVEVPDLATLKNFFRFVAASSKGMIMEKSTPKSLNTSGKWFFAGFSRITGTPTDAGNSLAKIQCLGP